MIKPVEIFYQPIRTIEPLITLVRTLRKISNLKVDSNIKSMIRKTYLCTFFLKMYNSKANIAGIVDYNVKFCTYQTLSWLFGEIFLSQEYYFFTNKKNPFIIDCGSNIGMSVIFFKMLYPNSEILAFEPDKETFRFLEQNIRLNNIDNVCLNRKALSNREGNINFYSDKDNPGSLIMSTVKERISKTTQVVESVLLSNYIDKEVDFLKVDIEGSEIDVIEELSKARKLNFVKQMAIEYHHHIVKDVDILSHILKNLEENRFGYQIGSHLDRPFKGQQFQDILIYAYQKDSTV